MRSPRSVILLAAVLCVAAASRGQEDDRTVVLSEFNGTGFDYAYLSFEGKVTAGEGAASIGGADVGGKGGAVVRCELDLPGMPDACPAIRLRLGAHNKAAALVMLIADADGTTIPFRFDLSKASADEFRTLYPVDGACLSMPNGAGKPGDVEGMDLSKVAQWQVQGDWKDTDVHVEIDRVVVTTDVPAELVKERKDLREKEAAKEARLLAEEQRVAARRAELLAGAPHPEDGPEILYVCTVTSGVLALTIQDRTVVNPGPQPYEPQEGEDIQRKGP